ncbi:hypothetical protein [Priestia megaterium]|uniref:hypothetical protein n=1 Tax=Priestia megaterium TaxID=1404 RepID=UPI002E246AAE|nr:hypothetical protein [Priestia megaterium]
MLKKEDIEFYINVDGDIVIDKDSFDIILEELDKIQTSDEACKDKVLGGKKQYCCTVRFDGDLLETYEYKEYPALAQGVCIRNTWQRCGTVNGCSGTLSRGYCDE